MKLALTVILLVFIGANLCSNENDEESESSTDESKRVSKLPPDGRLITRGDRVDGYQAKSTTTKKPKNTRKPGTVDDDFDKGTNSTVGKEPVGFELNKEAQKANKRIVYWILSTDAAIAFFVLVTFVASLRPSLNERPDNWRKDLIEMDPENLMEVPEEYVCDYDTGSECEDEEGDEDEDGEEGEDGETEGDGEGEDGEEGEGEDIDGEDGDGHASGEESSQVVGEEEDPTNIIEAEAEADKASASKEGSNIETPASNTHEGEAHGSNASEAAKESKESNASEAAKESKEN